MPIPADITPEKIQSLLTGRIIGRRLRVVAEIGSTNDAAMAAGRAGEPEGLAILADQQTNGRGRLGRTWASFRVSVSTRPSFCVLGAAPSGAAPDADGRPRHGRGHRGRRAGDADAEVAQRCPVRRAKGGRILTEMATTGQQIGHVAIGVGINVRHRAKDFPADVRETATSIEMAAGRRWIGERWPPPCTTPWIGGMRSSAARGRTRSSSRRASDRDAWTTGHRPGGDHGGRGSPWTWIRTGPCLCGTRRAPFVEFSPTTSPSGDRPLKRPICCVCCWHRCGVPGVASLRFPSLAALHLAFLSGLAEGQRYSAGLNEVRSSRRVADLSDR